MTEREESCVQVSLPRNKNLVPVRAESDCRFIGTLAMIDFDSVLVSEQPYATKHISVNPMFQFKLKGEMVLLPNMDVWSDTTRLPELTVNVDTGVEEIRKLATAAGVLGTQWGSWADLNSTSQSASSSSTVAADQWGGTSTTTTTTTNTTTNQTRSGTNTTMDTKTTAYDMGDRVNRCLYQPVDESYRHHILGYQDVWQYEDLSVLRWQTCWPICENTQGSSWRATDNG